MKRTLSWTSGAADVACMGASTLAIAARQQLAVITLDGARVCLRRDIELPSVASELWISSSERWLFATFAGHQRGWIVDLAAGSAPVEVAALEDRPVLAGTFARVGGQEMALVVRSRGRIDGYRLETGSWDFSISFPGFRFDTLAAIGESERVLAVGRWDADSRIALGVIDANRHDDHAVEQLFRATAIMDESERLCAGPCGGDAFVAFRDPEGYEDPDDLPDDEGCRFELWGLCGAYVRRLDGTVVQQIAIDPRWEGRAPASGGPSTLAVGGKDVIYLVDRASEQVVNIAARWLAAAPDGGRVLIEQDGELAILEL